MVGHRTWVVGDTNGGASPNAGVKAAGLLLRIAENSEMSLFICSPIFGVFPEGVCYSCCFVCVKPMLEIGSIQLGH